MSMTLCEGMSDGIDHHTGTLVVVIGIVAYPVATEEIGLVLDGTGTCEQLPSILARLRPIGNDDDGIVLHTCGITAPTGETQVITGEQQESETTIADDGMLLSRRIVTVLMTIGEEVVFVVTTDGARRAVDEIVTITVAAVLQAYGQAAADGTMTGSGLRLHPSQCGIAGFVRGYPLRLCGKSRAPHLGQHVEVTLLALGKQLPGSANVLIGVGPADVRLQEGNYQYSSNLVEV